MIKEQAKTLFQLQTDLIDTKVNMAVNNAIDRVVEQITNLRYEMHTEIGSLRHEMHDLKTEMNNRFSSLDNRVIAIETRLGMINAKRKVWHDRLLDYIFKTGWVWGSISLVYLMNHFAIVAK